MSVAAAPIRHAPLEFWRIAEAFLRTLWTLFGGPEAVAAQHTLTAKQHALLASWLRVAEALVRRLLLIEARAYRGAPVRLSVRANRPRRRRLVEFHPDKPEDWRVSLNLMGPRHHNGARRRKRPDASSLHFHDAWPLALRFEALLRAFNEPVAYAKRLARRLQAEPKAAERLLRAPPEYAHRVDRAEEITKAAQQPSGKPDSS